MCKWSPRFACKRKQLHSSSLKGFTCCETVPDAFCNMEIIKNGNDIPTDLSDCHKLIQTSGHLGCTDLISNPNQFALFKYGQDLLQSVQGVPYVRSGVTCSIRIGLIHRGCTINIAGDWKAFKKKLSAFHRLHVPSVFDLTQKYKNLKLGILLHYPQAVRLPPGEYPSNARPTKRIF